MVGKRYQFQGIMSVAKDGNDKMARDGVVFKIIAPKGTPGLDLVDVGYFSEASLIRRFCYIEKVEKTGPSHNTPYITVRVYSSKSYHNIVDELKGNVCSIIQFNHLDGKEQVKKLLIGSAEAILQKVHVPL